MSTQLDLLANTLMGEDDRTKSKMDFTGLELRRVDLLSELKEEEEGSESHRDLQQELTSINLLLGDSDMDEVAVATENGNLNSMFKDTKDFFTEPQEDVSTEGNQVAIDVAKQAQIAPEELSAPTPTPDLRMDDMIDRRDELIAKRGDSVDNITSGELAEVTALGMLINGYSLDDLGDGGVKEKLAKVLPTVEAAYRGNGEDLMDDQVPAPSITPEPVTPIATTVPANPAPVESPNLTQPDAAALTRANAPVVPDPVVPEVRADGLLEGSRTGAGRQLDNNFVPANYETHRQKADRLRKERLEKGGFFEQAWTVMSEDSIGVNMYRAYDRWSESGERDAGFDLSKDDASLKFLYANYTDSDVAFLEESISKEDYAKRMTYLTEDKERDAMLQKLDLAPTLFAYVFDPVAVSVSVATAGLYNAAQVTRLGNALRTGLLVTGETFALEALAVQGNSQKDIRDALIASSAGFILGSTLGSLRKGAGHGDLKTNLDSIDLIKSESAKKEAYELEKSRTLTLEQEAADGRIVVEQVEMYTIDLAEKADGRVMSPAKVAKSEEYVKTTEKELDDLYAERWAEKQKVEETWSGDFDSTHILPRNKERALPKTIAKQEAEVQSIYIQGQEAVRNFWAKHGMNSSPNVHAAHRYQADKITAEFAERARLLQEPLDANRTLLNRSQDARRASNLKKMNPKQLAKRLEQALDDIGRKYTSAMNNKSLRIEAAERSVRVSKNLAKAKQKLADFRAKSPKEQQRIASGTYTKVEAQRSLDSKKAIEDETFKNFQVGVPIKGKNGLDLPTKSELNTMVAALTKNYKKDMKTCQI